VPQPSVALSVAVRRVLSQAFVNDPLFVWIFPDEEMRPAATAAWMGLFVEEYLLHAHVDTVEIDGETVAAALWRPTYAGPLPYPEYPSLPGLLGAFVGADRQSALGQGLHAFAAARPEVPFAYLHFLAVAPDRQGQGLGRQLIQRGLDAATSAALGVHLETTNPTTLAFYRSLGFDVSHEFTLEPDGPPAWTMWRPNPEPST
jgi:ribosomal protein S18 acetylase RimI-like enzyme